MSFTLAELIRRHARERGGSTALVCDERRLTYAELDARSSRVANALTGLGVGVGDRIAVLAKNSIEFYELAYGAAKIGAIVVGLNWRLAAPEIAAIVADCEPAALVFEGEHRDLLSPADAEGAPRIELGEAYEDWLAGAAAEDPTAVEPDPAATVLLLYSSGTTGTPKGIMISNENLSHSATMARQGFRMDADSVNLVPSPLFHIGGAGYGLMAQTTGGTTVIARQAAPEELLAAIGRERVTHTFLVPAVIQTVVEHPDVGKYDLSSLRLVSYGAAPMNETLLRRAIDVLGCDFLGVYGMTETAGTVVALDPEDHHVTGDRTHLLRSVGKPLAWLEIRITEVDGDAEMAPGQVGEICVRSSQNTAGYWNQPETTRKALGGDGWLRTGDAGYRDEEGYVFLHDRIKDMVISGGENVYPAEVENALTQHPDVADVAVIGVPHERWGETVKAIVVRRPGASVEGAELREFTRERLARYKCPTSVDFRDELPRNASGKVLKHVLRDEYADLGAGIS
jgi:long-chain acyl-CoA synthetase